jgi:uncharacterized membrane protein YfcA
VQHVFLFAVAVLAGAINSVAGGGTLLTFPMLLAVGVPPIAANATSTVALVPGSLSAFWGYRTEMGSGRRELVWYGVPSLVGGASGALLVTRIGDAAFARLVPWLIFGATALFVGQAPVRRLLDRRSRASSESSTTDRHQGTTDDGRREGEQREAPARDERLPPMAAIVFQLVIATYGGFFGAGIGILMLAGLGFLGVRGIHRMNGLKNFAAVLINGVAAITFIALGRVQWPLAILMAIGASLGGLAGAGVAKKVGEKNVRRCVVVIGLAMGVLTLLRRA